MSTITALWQSIETQYNNGTFPTDQLEKIDVLVFSDNIENIRNGLTLMTTIAPKYLCRYLELDGESVVPRDADRFSDPLSAERVLVESAKSESMWQDLYESGAFESMAFRALGDVAIENLSESEKDFCVRMAKELVLAPAGEFMMGALEDDEDADDEEKPRHKVTLTRDFLIGKYAVTQALWESVMGSNPSKFKGANRPVEKVSWLDVVSFCNKLSEREGLEPVYSGLGDYQVGQKFDDEDSMERSEKGNALSKKVRVSVTANGYRLPTEAEWEYAARGGEYHKYSGSDNVDEVAWYDGNSGYETHPVGQKKSNGFGLYDMSGNVYEWVWDYFGGYSSDSVVNPTGISSASYRVLRGGSWYNDPKGIRASYRSGPAPTHQNYYIGFRLSRISP